MQKILIIIFLSALGSPAQSQNLIRNPSFEDSIPSGEWATSLGVCFQTPITLANNLQPNEATAFINFESADGLNCAFLSLFQCKTGWSDYLIGKTSKLEKGKKYEFSFLITPSDSCGYYSKTIDFLFCNVNFISKNISCAIPGKVHVTPTLSFDISKFKTSGQEGNWIKYTGEFTANGDENCIVIGRFFGGKSVKKNVSTKKFKFKPSKKFIAEQFCSADYYLDSFFLSEK